MNILMVNTTDYFGGAARVMRSLAKSLKSIGHDVRSLVGYRYLNDQNMQEISTNEFWKFSEKYISKKVRLYSRHLRSYLLADDIDFFNVDEIINHPWFKRADIVHLHNLHGQYFNLNSLSYISNLKPTVWTLHDMWAPTAHCGFCNDCKIWNNGKHFTSGWRHYQPMLWDNSCYLWNKKHDIYNSSKLNLVTPSKWLADLVERDKNLSKFGISVIPNGIDLMIFYKRDKKEIRKELRFPLDKQIYIFVANGGLADVRKGGYLVEELINRRKDSGDIFLIVGGNKYFKDGNVIYYPYVKDKEFLAKLYCASDAFLDFSILESFSLVRMEAGACGVKLLTPDMFGFKFKGGDVMKKLNLVEQAPAIFGIEEMTKRYLGLYEKVLGK